MFEAWQLQGWQSAPCALRGLLGPRPLRPRSPRCQEGTRPRGAAETGGQGPPPSGPLAPSLVGGPSPLPSPVLWLQVSGSQAPGHAGQGGPGESQQLAQSPGEGTWEGLGEGFRKWKGYWRHDPGQALRIQPEARGSHWMCDSLPTCTGLYFLPQRPPPSFLHASQALQGDRTTPLAPPLAWALSPRDTIRNSAYGGVPVTRKASAPLKGTECLGGRSASWAESTLGRVHQPASPVASGGQRDTGAWFVGTACEGQEPVGPTRCLSQGLGAVAAKAGEGGPGWGARLAQRLSGPPCQPPAPSPLHGARRSSAGQDRGGQRPARRPTCPSPSPSPPSPWAGQ